MPFCSCHVWSVNIVLFAPRKVVIGLKTPYLRAKVQSFQIVSVVRPPHPHAWGPPWDLWCYVQIRSKVFYIAEA